MFGFLKRKVEEKKPLKKEENRGFSIPGWNELGKPTDYIVSVTPGFSKFAQGEARLAETGFGRKLMKASRLGADFVQIDIEDVSEIYEPGMVEEVKYVKNVQGLETGVHLPTNMDLCVARAYVWKQMHDQLKRSTVGCAAIDSKYILFHSSSEARPNLTSTAGQRVPPVHLFSFRGTNLGAFLIKESQKKYNGKQFDFQDWFMAKFIDVLFRAMGTAGDPGIISYFDEMAIEKGYGFKQSSKELEKELKKYMDFREKVKKEIEEKILQLNKRLQELQEQYKNTEDKEKITEEINKVSKELSRLRSTAESEIERRMEEAGIKEKFEKVSNIYRYLHNYDFNTVYTYWSRHGSEAEEQVAYHVIAKWMYFTKDPLWHEIYQIPHNDYRDPDVIVNEANEVLSSVKGRASKADVIQRINSVITAVAAKYLEGHLRTTALPEYGIPKRLANGSYARDKEGNILVQPIIEFCRNKKMQIFIETNMPGGYGESTGGAPPGELRIIKATDHIRIVRCVDPDVLSYTIDFEHLLTNYIDPIEEAKRVKELGWGGYINCLHINAPKPIAGTHGPIALYSKEMYTLYKFLYELRQGGWKNSYMVWEMGSFGVGESAVAFRKFTEALRKDIPPDKLTKEFFGIDKNFEARQMSAIMEHAYDPLEGMLMVPEEKHTFLSGSAAQRGKHAEWDRERYK